MTKTMVSVASAALSLASLLLHTRFLIRPTLLTR
jgi:hypothetical protein